MAVLGGWAVSYQRGTPSEEGTTDVYGEQDDELADDEDNVEVIPLPSQDGLRCVVLGLQLVMLYRGGDFILEGNTMCPHIYYFMPYFNVQHSIFTLV